LWIVGAGMIAALLGLAIVFFLLELVWPKVAAIAWTTGKEAVSQPLFYVVLAVGAFLLVLSLFLPYFTFGEDVKVVEENGLTLIMVLSIILALWTASLSVSDEIEGRTALTVLSKPISRRDFIVGKFLGIVGPVAILFILLGAFFLCSVSFKVVYDARESALTEPGWQQCRAEMVQIAPGLALAFFETVVMTSISVAVSTRLGMLPNLVICLSIYVLGHLVPMLAKSAMGQTIVPFVADLLAAVLPVLDHFNIYGAIATGERVPAEYLAWAGGYCVLYSSVALLVALFLFEDRDLA
jgi:ABC-type transport system involved in multi-copper enzyme maturation permease subunit